MLEIREIRKTFHAGTPNEVRALQGVTLTIEEGSFVIVIGTNGSGKSTLLNAVAGTFLADAGSIRLDGNDVTRWPEHRRASLIGRVFQNPFSGTAPTLSVAENLALATRRGLPRTLGWALRGGRESEMREAVRRLNMGLEDRLPNPIGTLSGGQRQALTLLMATWRKPKLLLLDEHTAALDPKSADQVIRLSEEIISHNKLTALNGDALDATSSSPGRPADHDAPGPRNTRSAGHREAKDASRGAAGSFRRDPAGGSARRNGSGDAGTGLRVKPATT